MRVEFGKHMISGFSLLF